MSTTAAAINGPPPAPPVTFSGRRRKLTDKQMRFVAEWAIDGNGKRAATAAGVPKKDAASVASQWLDEAGRFQHVALAAREAQRQRDRVLIKKASDIRQYIHTIMYFEPLKFFEPGDHGGWLMKEEFYENIPPAIGCLIEEIERREFRETDEDGNETITVKYWVKLVSKTAAMQLAAKHQLTERTKKVKATVGFDFDKLAAPPDPDEVEKAITAGIEGVKVVEAEVKDAPR